MKSQYNSRVFVFRSSDSKWTIKVPSLKFCSRLPGLGSGPLTNTSQITVDNTIRSLHRSFIDLILSFWFHHFVHSDDLIRTLPIPPPRNRILCYPISFFFFCASRPTAGFQGLYQVASIEVDTAGVRGQGEGVCLFKEEQGGRAGVGGRQAGSRKRGGEVRWGPQWGRRGACRGSAAPAPGSPAPAPAPPPTCCRCASHWCSSWRPRLHPPLRARPPTPRWVWWRPCRRRTGWGLRPSGSRQSRWTSAARGPGRTESPKHKGLWVMRHIFKKGAF